MGMTARLVGGAGTGKTRELIEIMERAKAGLGGSPFALGFASFTRAARTEAAQRAADAWGIPAEVLTRDGWFKTAHATAYRQLGIKKGQLLGTDKESQLWLAEALGVDVRVILDADTGRSQYTGDHAASRAIQAWEISRARVEPLRETIKRMAAYGEQTPTWGEVRQYVTKYEAAKRSDDRFDYSDLLSRFAGIRFHADGFDEVQPEGETPPSVRAWIFDEAQDASELVHRVCLRLSESPIVQWTYLAGDPFQSVFSFGGSDSKHFMNWKADKEKVMPRSWRCPAPILELGEKCLRRMRNGYWDRGIAPADHDGIIEQSSNPTSSISSLCAETDTLILARCKYTLKGYSEALRRMNLPHAMLNDSRDTQILRAYRAYWDLEHNEAVTGEDLACAIQATPTKSLKGALLNRGVKAAWGRSEIVRGWDMVVQDNLADIGMTPELVEKIKQGQWGGLLHNAERWREAARKYGPDLATAPRIRLGTIHSTKGMEADTVVLSTAVSRKVSESQETNPEIYDEEKRVEYVAVTRSKRRLIISHDPSDHAMRLPL